MSGQKPPIHDAEIDEILEQIQKKRGDARPVQGTDADVNAILAELGIESAPKRAKPEPVLLPEPEFVRSKKRAAQRAEAASLQEAAARTQPASPAGAAQAKPAARPGKRADTAPRRAPAQHDAPRPEAPKEKPTLELPNIKAYSRAEAQKHAEERARLLEQARQEAKQELRDTARAEAAAHPAREPDERERAQKEAAAPKREAPAERRARTGSAAAPKDEAPAVTGNNLFGEVDDRFRDFFSSAVIDDPTQKEPGHRKKEKGGLLSKLFAKRDEEEDAGLGAQDTGEYYEAAQEEGFSEAFEAIRSGQAAPGPDGAEQEAQPRTAVWTDPGATPLSASIVARAITGTDSFSFGATNSAHGFAVDVDLPLPGDGTAEYERQRGTGDALSPEEDLEEYSSLSDAPMVAGELAAMRQTRMVRTVFTGALALFLVYLGLSARVEWLLPIAALDPHTAPLAYLVTNFALLAVTAFSSITTIGAGLRGLVRRPTADSFAALATVAAALQNAAYLFTAKTFDPDTVTLFAPAAALLLCGNALGKWMQLRAVCANFALASSGEEHAAAFLLEKEQLTRRLCEGLGEEGEPRLLLNRPTALVKGFLGQSFSAHPLDDGAQKLCWALCAAGLVCAVAAWLKGGPVAALSGLAGALALGAPLAATLCCALPTQLLQSAAARCGAVVPGPSAVRALGSANTVLLRARDLFPAGSVRLHGIKTFEKERIDLAILYAASLLSVRCETLRGVFMGMLDNNEKLLAKVENATTEIGHGFTGWIDGNRVLLGNREMMRRHDIEVPSLDYENRYTKNGQRSPIYLAVSGKLFGMFLVSYRPSRRAAEALSRLADSGASVLIQAEDFNITAQLVADAYGLPEGAVKVLSQAEQDALEAELSYRPESEGVMIHNGSCASLLGGMYAAARAAAGERLAGLALAAAVGMGIVAGVAISFSQGLAGLSLGLVLAYQLIWSAAIAAAPFLKKP